jgi:hypothetical protein
MEIQEILVRDRTVTRRSFIKGVIAAGATVSASSYLFRRRGRTRRRPLGRWSGW